MSGVDDRVGWLGLDVPVELITAAGFTPARLTADAERPSPSADPFAEGLGHPLLRALTGQLIDSGLKRLIVSTTPSYFAALFAFLRETKRLGAGFSDLELCLFDLNRAPDAAMDSARRGAVVNLKAQLEAWSGSDTSEEDLSRGIKLTNGRRKLLHRLNERRVAGEISGVEFIEAVQFADKGSSSDALHATKTLLERDAVAVPGRRAIYSGSETPDAGIYRALEAEGWFIVADDQDCGSRAIGPRVEDTGDPLDALARRYLHRNPAPARWPLEARIDWMLRQVEATRAEAVIFNIAPWDHPAAWEVPELTRALEAKGVEVIIRD